MKQKQMDEAHVLVLATGNPHKVDEIGKMMSGWQVKGLQTLGIGDVSWEETGETFLDNALIKAFAVRKVCPLAVLADDSGLVVPALCGAPGVYSARYAGNDASDAENNAKLLQDMKGLEGIQRAAKFVCQLVFLDEVGRWFDFVGEVHGVIASKIEGDQGFGYDPLFVPEGFDQTFGQLGSAVKNSMSHRGRAMQALNQWLAVNRT